MFPQADHNYKFYLLEQAILIKKDNNSFIQLDEQMHFLKKSFFKEAVDNTLDNLVSHYIVKILSPLRDQLTIYYRGYKGLMTYDVGNTSIIGNALITSYPEFDFIVNISPVGTMSLRANNKVDVSIIAKEWANGGGHPNASGGRIKQFKEQFSYSKVLEQIKVIIKKVEPQSILLIKE
jgi:oligoribonuclease NrnB/cAMP/cGMP phosphodiesterase (DHH superfamily)